MQRSTQRHSYPLDKQVPQFRQPKKGHIDRVNYVHTTEQRQCTKELHKTKQRQYDNKIVHDELDRLEAWPDDEAFFEEEEYARNYDMRYERDYVHEYEWERYV